MNSICWSVGTVIICWHNSIVNNSKVSTPFSKFCFLCLVVLKCKTCFDHFFSLTFWGCWAGRTGLQIFNQFFYLILFDMPFPRLGKFVAYIKTKFPEWRELFKICAKFWSTKKAISETVRHKSEMDKF